MVKFVLYASSIGAVLGRVDGLKLAKNYPGSPEYPDAAAWQSLGAQVGNRLQVCSGSSNRACGAASLRSEYAVSAFNADDVAAALKFATKHKLRVTVRNTGHDFLARHSGVGGLTISTTGIKGVTYHPSWTPSVGPANVVKRRAGVTAVVLGSGSTFNDLGLVLKPKGQATVRGADSTVGVAGWIQGGGHGPYTSVYGLGADNALEFQIVLTNGTLVTANEHSNPDLFWALRGGGASTYGVVTRITMKTFPRPDVASSTIIVGAVNRDAFLDAMAYFFALTPNMSDYGITGYPSMTALTYSGYLALPGKNSSQLQAFMDPIATKMKSYGATVAFLGVNSRNKGILKRDNPNIPDVMAQYHNNRQKQLMKRQEKLNFRPVHDIPVADMASRLLSRKALSVENLPQIRKMLAGLKGNLLPYGNLGGKVTQNAHLDLGLNPAWRRSAMHIIALNYDIKYNTGELDRLSADHAAYWNEGFDKETDWKTTYFGPPDHYAKLLAIKKKYDPTNTLWCSICVGADVFTKQQGKLYHAE